MNTCVFRGMNTLCMCGYMCCFLILWYTHKHMNVLCDMCKYIPKYMCMTHMDVQHV